MAALGGVVALTSIFIEEHTAMSENASDVVSSRAPKPVGLYPHAKRVGNLLFLSGIGPREPGTNAIPGNVADDAGNVLRYDIAAQCHSVFRNVRAVLEDAGGELGTHRRCDGVSDQHEG